MKCVTAIQMYDVNFSRLFQFYTNASNFEDELIITQHQNIFENIFKKRTIEMFILYDAFSLFRTQKIYFIYKKKLCVFVKFVMKYDYMCKHSYNVITIHTDHRSLIRFLKFDFHEDMYEHSIDQFRRLNIDIRYISEFKNKMIDELFKIIFLEDECFFNFDIKNALKKIQKNRSWIWKNDKKEYEEFLNFLSWNKKNEIIQKRTLNEISVFVTIFEMIENNRKNWQNCYRRFNWFEKYYIYLKSESLFEHDSKIFKKTFDHKIDHTDFLWKSHRNVFLSCISEDKIVFVFRKVHDKSEHWNKVIIFIKLRNMTYWSDQFDDVERYIAECIQCARHESAIRSQSLHFIQMMHSFDFAIMNFIKSFKETAKNKKYIFHFMNYFTKFFVSTVCKTANVSDVIKCLRKIFRKYRKSVEIYCDHEQHFDNEKLRAFLKSKVKIIYSSLNASKSTKIIEMNNKLLQNVLRKIVMKNEWDIFLSAFTKFLNFHQIRHLRLSFQDVLLNFETSVLAIDSKLITASNVETAVNIMIKMNDFRNQKETIRKYFKYRAETHDFIRIKSNARKEEEMIRYDRKIDKTIHEIKFLIMIYQKDVAKLQFKWRGSFKIRKYERIHQVSFILNQLNDRKIKKNFHDDHFKIYFLKIEHLLNSLHSDENLMTYQIIRHFKKKKRDSKTTFWYSISKK